jgi:hypothetical protein
LDVNLLNRFKIKAKSMQPVSGMSGGGGPTDVVAHAGGCANAWRVDRPPQRDHDDSRLRSTISVPTASMANASRCAFAGSLRIAADASARLFRALHNHPRRHVDA